MAKLFCELCSDIYKEVIHDHSLVGIIRQKGSIAIKYWRYRLPSVLTLSLFYHLPKFVAILIRSKLVSPV